MRITISIILFFLIICIKGYNQQNDTAINRERSTNKPVVSLLRGPYLQVATSNSIIIRWRTNVMTRSRVRFGFEPEKLNGVVDDNSLVTEHEIKLIGLLPQTKYYYSIGTLKDTLQGNTDNYFSTFPDAGKEGLYRIGVFGDPGLNSINQYNVRDAFVNYLSDNYLNAWIVLGDNAYSDGSDAEYQAKFFNVYKDKLLKKYPLFPSPGNHDYHDVDFKADYAQMNHTTAYYQNFTMPTRGEAGGYPSGTESFYSFDLGNIHFLSLDSYGLEDKKFMLYDTIGRQAQWIKKDLATNNNKDWVIAYWHHPPYTMGSHNSDEESELGEIREKVLPILERYGVDLVLCGHSHVYERSRLMKGYYGKEADFDEVKYNINSSSAKDDGTPNSAPYVKKISGPGTVYVVTGSAGPVGGIQKSFPHAAMYYSNGTIGGATMLEVKGNKLTLKWICADGVIRDQFTMVKEK